MGESGGGCQVSLRFGVTVGLKKLEKNRYGFRSILRGDADKSDDDSPINTLLEASDEEHQ